MSEKFNTATLETVAKLARLKLTAPAEEKLAKELPAILLFVAGLNKVAKGEVTKVDSGPALLIGRPDATLPKRWPLSQPKSMIEMAPAKRGDFIEVTHVFN